MTVQIRSRRGFSIMEVAVTSSIMLALALGMGAAVAVASRGLPSEGNPVRARVEGAATLASMAAEIGTALHVKSPGVQSIEFTVADRNGDGVPERIKYHWDALDTRALLRTYNGGAPTPVAHDVKSIQFQYGLVTVQETYPGPPPIWPEEVLFSHNTSSSLSEQDIKSDVMMSQYFVPAMPADALSWSVTRVQFVARRKNSKSYTLRAQLRTADVFGLPTATILEEALIPQLSLSDSAMWFEQSYKTVTGRTPGSGLCFYLTTTDPDAGKITYRSGGVSMSGSGLVIKNPGSLLPATDLKKDQALLINVYGKVERNVVVPDKTLTRYFFKSVRILLRTGDDSKDTVIETMFSNGPEAMSTRYITDFTSNPTTLDYNGDGFGDFKEIAGALAVSDYGGAVLTPSCPIELSVANNFVKTTNVEVPMRDATTGGGGAGFWMEADRSGSTYAAFEAVIAAQSDGTQSLVVSMKTAPGTMKPLVTMSVPPGQFASVRYIIDPTGDSIAVQVNGAHMGTFNYVRVTDTDKLGVRLYRVSSDTGAQFRSFDLALAN